MYLSEKQIEFLNENTERLYNRHVIECSGVVIIVAKYDDGFYIYPNVCSDPIEMTESEAKLLAMVINNVTEDD